VPTLPAVQAFLASVQLMSGLRKVPPERWARSCGMTSAGGICLDLAGLRYQNCSLESAIVLELSEAPTG
jgi:hypothetical protein